MIAVVLQQIKSAERDLLVVLLRVQQVEVGQAVRAADDALAVEQDRADLELANRLDDPREALRPVSTTACVNAHPIVLLADHQAVAVVLDLVDPVWTARRFVRARWQARLDEPGRGPDCGAVTPAHAPAITSSDRKLQLFSGSKLSGPDLWGSGGG